MISILSIVKYFYMFKGYNWTGYHVVLYSIPIYLSIHVPEKSFLVFIFYYLIIKYFYNVSMILELISL